MPIYANLKKSKKTKIASIFFGAMDHVYNIFIEQHCSKEHFELTITYEYEPHVRHFKTIKIGNLKPNKKWYSA